MDNSFLKTRTLTLLNDTNAQTLLETTAELASFFGEITGISAADLNTHKDIMLASGKAIAPGKAAHCLKEFLRTKVFLQGIYQAINDVLQQKDAVHILYAGTGPYGTLITPLLTLFTPQQVRLTLMDINEVSLDALKTLYTHLNFNDFVDDYIIADAAIYQLPEDENADIMISETMQAALKKEPQVSIMQNLIPQLKPGGIFIPQQIKISAQLMSWKAETAYSLGEADSPNRLFLKDIYTISETSLPGEAETSVDIPADITHNMLSLFTDIYVYKNNLLTVNNCSLNLPMQITRLDNDMANKQITFKYNINDKPGFTYSIN